ncbi:hypothetical protein DFA_01242 [Cavenderia fasciculata]|uniref:4a-hydroxytetrahydrobiopterin dehydratase n=1 Tax=Cavenderia fasciculata TaxID=261658 RepID=F4PRM1_CACFS|nr:uncharacterized protein DFA_01242 [Cavenderia fasciculata]EGG21361.1 hypothetical protein DFA_01242 [Cavenderia fasciculata]|eukprot:XP_004359211.1 hypothetical protein DFA_01242 [Cavenderia fasciculata]
MSYCTLSKEQLSQKKCLPCEGGIPKLSNTESEELLKNLNENWRIIYKDNEAYMVTRKWRIPFPKGLELMSQIGALAEDENHHPDMSINISTHLIIPRQEYSRKE